MSQPSQTPPPARIPLMKIPVAFYGISYNYKEAVTVDPGNPGKPKDVSLTTHASPESLNQLDAYINLLASDLIGEISKVQQAKGPVMVTENITQAVWAMPIVLHRLPTDCEIPIKLMPLLHDHMYYVYSTYCASKDKSLSGFLQGYPEYLYHILTEAKSDPIPSSERRFFIEQLLKINPYWAIKWLDSHYDEKDFGDLLSNIYYMREHDAAAAHCYHWLKTRSATPEVKKEELVKILETLAGTPYVALLTALQYPDVNVDSLLAGIEKCPMWSYNWLRLVGDRRGNVNKMLETLSQWTPWGVQYLEDMQFMPRELRMSPEDASDLWASVKVKAVNPYWTEWFDRYQDKREKKRT